MSKSLEPRSTYNVGWLKMVQRLSIGSLVTLGFFVIFSFNACGGSGSSINSTGMLSTNWKLTDHSTSVRAQIPNNNVQVLSMSDDEDGLLLSLRDHHNTRHRIVHRSSSGAYTLIGQFEGSAGVVVDGVTLGGAYTLLQGHYGNLTDGLRVIADPYVVDLKNGNAPSIVSPVMSDRMSETFHQFTKIPGTNNTLISTHLATNRVVLYDNSTTVQSVSGGSGSADFFIDSSNQIWYVDIYDNISKWDGTSFLKIYDGKLIDTETDAADVSVNSVYVVSENDIYVAIGHKIFHFDGAAWTKEYESAMSYFTRIRGNGDIVVAVGDNGLISVREANGSWADVSASDIHSSYLTQIHFPKNTPNSFWAGGMNQLYYVSR